MHRLSFATLVLGLGLPVRAVDIVVSSNGSYASSSTLYGIMFEDISHSGDGGIYAELLQNRAFQKVTPGSSSSLVAWSSVGNASIAVVNDTDSLSTALPNSLKVSSPTVEGNVGVANSGYWGIAVNTSWKYTASFYAKSSKPLKCDITVSLVNLDGTVIASTVAVHANKLSKKWTQYSAVLSPSIAPASVNNSLQITYAGSAARDQDVYFALFSLFPPTYKNRANGLRIDLAETLKSMNPSFFRGMGGNNLEGETFDTRWKWNETIGPLTERPGRVGDWTYVNTDGLGLQEYLDLCEDFDIEPFMAVHSGYSLGGEIVSRENFHVVWEAAINQIQFAIGDPETNQYAALRAKYGHPAPYKVTKIEIGNEDQFALESYEAYRYSYLAGNISAVFPHLELMASNAHNDGASSPSTTYPLLPSPQLLDSHNYDTPEWFIENEGYYDPANWTRNATGVKVFQGEYAVTASNASCLFASVDCGRYAFPKFYGSLAEATYMTGMERNSDLVFAAAYAPVLQNINNYQWIPNAISFDAGRVVRSTSFYVQQLFSVNRGDIILPVSPVRSPPVYYVASKNSKTGTVYIKATNVGASAKKVSIAFDGVRVGSHGTATTLASTDVYASNTPEEPDTVVPVVTKFKVTSSFKYTLPAYSVVILAFAA